ncbi:protein polyglycylase TTLL10-like isoform X2 [Babylonia areolata]|uniref:protein polyglycylase TTLL10-like isoform X2 n=1 Tax=Babylonia areolata TaxID=304850 RepID=UPI003FD13639
MADTQSTAPSPAASGGRSSDEKSGGGGAGGGGGDGRKTQTVSGGGGGPGVGGGGGGGRPTKLPSCSLPVNMTPCFFVGGGNGTALVEKPLLEMGWRRITERTDDRFRLKWTECKSKINYAAFREGDQIVNHIPNGKLLTNKLGLLSSLQEYERVTFATKGRFPRLRLVDFFPETYRLDERVDRAVFLNLYKDGETWICKPIGLNQGKGIFLLRTREEIDQILAEREAKKESYRLATRPPTMRLVQRYITNPLLLEGRKFDIRAYMLIASTMPYLILFQHGYIRLSCHKYDHDDTDLTTHLTNQFIQKKDPSYQDVKETTAWSMHKFNDYVNQNYAAEKGVEQDWAFKTMTKQMQRIVLHCFNSVKHKLDCRLGYFDLYGLDFMIDADMKVWLIEINVNPCLATNCSALKAVIPGVVDETIRVAVEAFDKSRKNQPLLPLQSLKHFQILHCGPSPFNARVPRQSRSVSPAKRDYRERGDGNNRERGRESPARATLSSTGPGAAHAPSNHGSYSGGTRGGGGGGGVGRRNSSPTQNLPRVGLVTVTTTTAAASSSSTTPRVSPYLRPTQGGNPGGMVLARGNPPSLPSISQGTTTTTTINNSNKLTRDPPPTTTPATVTITFLNNGGSQRTWANKGKGDKENREEGVGGGVISPATGTGNGSTGTTQIGRRRRDKAERGN